MTKEEMKALVAKLKAQGNQVDLEGTLVEVLDALVGKSVDFKVDEMVDPFKMDAQTTVRDGYISQDDFDSILRGEVDEVKITSREEGDSNYFIFKLVSYELDGGEPMVFYGGVFMGDTNAIDDAYYRSIIFSPSEVIYRKF